MVQGVSVGGEYTTSVVFLVEAAPPGGRGLAGSWSTVGAVLGTLMGSAVGALVTTFIPAAVVYEWGWRLQVSSALAAQFSCGRGWRSRCAASQPGGSGLASQCRRRLESREPGA
jgi:MFS family permease